jgi:hypothetical protein
MKMSTSNENDQERQSEKQPTAPTPRGGGDISGKGISEPSGPEGGDESKDTGGGKAGGGESSNTDDA